MVRDWVVAYIDHSLMMGNHKKYNLKFIKLAILLILFISLPGRYISAQINISGGNVSGTWIKGSSPYQIFGEISIQSGQTLTIEPGVKVIFHGHYKFNVHGRLLAIGTETDSILFTAQNKNEGWLGIKFLENSKFY